MGVRMYTREVALTQCCFAGHVGLDQNWAGCGLVGCGVLEVVVQDVGRVEFAFFLDDGL